MNLNIRCHPSLANSASPILLSPVPPEPHPTLLIDEKACGGQSLGGDYVSLEATSSNGAQCYPPPQAHLTMQVGEQA